MIYMIIYALSHSYFYLGSLSKFAASRLIINLIISSRGNSQGVVIISRVDVDSDNINSYFNVQEFDNLLAESDSNDCVDDNGHSIVTDS